MQMRSAPPAEAPSLRTTPAEEAPRLHAPCAGPPPRSATEDDPLYPCSDGKPMAENDWQLWAIIRLISSLGLHYRDRPDVQAGGNNLIYYEEGDPAKRIAPDVYVAFDVPKHKRMVYKVWEEGKAPDFVLEVASRSTWRRDQSRKRKLYAKLGVREFWLFDPQGKFFDPPLEGYVLEGRAYRPLPGHVENEGWVMRSQVLGLDLVAQGEELRLRDPDTGELLPNLEEAEARATQESAARRKAEARANREAKACQAAETRIAELEARIRELERKERTNEQ